MTSRMALRLRRSLFVTRISTSNGNLVQSRSSGSKLKPCGCRYYSSTRTREKPKVVISATNMKVNEFRQIVTVENGPSSQYPRRMESPSTSTTSTTTPSSSISITGSPNKTATRTKQHFSSLASPEAIEDDDILFQDVSIEHIQALASQTPTPLRLADIYRYGSPQGAADPSQRLRNAQFLHKELPIRVAQRVVDLLTLPHGLAQAEPIRQVAAIYILYLKRLQDLPVPTNAEQEGVFTDLLQSLVLDRTRVPQSIARGVKTWLSSLPPEDPSLTAAVADMEQALYRFFTARVGVRFLIEHHVLSSSREACRELRSVTNMFSCEDEEEYRGCIQSNVNVAQEIRKVAELVKTQTAEYLKSSTTLLGDMENTTTDDNDNNYDWNQAQSSTGGLQCPEIIIVDCNKSQQGFTYVPHHLHYMLTELIKNSVRATIRHHYRQCYDDGTPDEAPPPPVKVIIAKGEEDVTIKVCDRGGGIPRSRMQTIWKFAHSTASESELETCDLGTDEVLGARIRGFGLPLARIYARYFGGELTLKSTEGYGLDAYLYIPRLGESCENMPLRVMNSPGERDSTPRKRHLKD